MHIQTENQPKIASTQEKREQGRPAGAALSLPGMNAEVSRANQMKRSQLNQLLRSPAAMARFQATGKLPEIPEPTSPLITLLESIPPRDRLSITGLTVGVSLGYIGSRSFHNAEQALRWCKPHNPGIHVPAESCRDRRRTAPLYLDDLLAHAAKYPEQILDRLSHLLSPVARAEQKRKREVTDTLPCPPEPPAL